MQPAEFSYFATILKKRSGLDLAEDKIYLLESRLLPVARQTGLEDISRLYGHLRKNPDEKLLSEVTEAMTTNESSFFRDIKPYDLFRENLLPMLAGKQASTRKLRLWSAACSSGQEPYSMAICLQEEAASMHGWEYDLIASDLAGKVVDKARQGIYSQFEVQRGLPIQLLIKYFTQLPDTSWQVKPPLRRMVDFRRLNLLDSYGELGCFDVIFCRNVMIYFDSETKTAVTRKMKQALQPHGVLIIGSTESLIDTEGDFVALEGFRGGYRLK